jgi:hypothetical protein
VKRSLAWLAGIVGIAALGRMLAKREAAPTPEQQPASVATTAAETGIETVADPAEELRRKLAANRQPETAETEVVETLEERRARIHAKAREAIDAMSEEEPAE